MSNQLSNILTEAGTNEVEILVFEVKGGFYGVNVAKVREIITPVPVTRLSATHEAVRGLFTLREHVHPLVDLRRFFGMPPAESEADSRVVVMEFNNDRMGFLVDKVDRIHRVSWKQISEVPWTGTGGDTAITGVLRIDDHMILMIDFERIMFKIAGVEAFEEASVEPAHIDRAATKVMLADDSATMRRMLQSSMETAGFQDIVIAHDGQEAFDKLHEMHQQGCLPDILVTDIEMPRMDGLYLTKRIKENDNLKHIPVIVFSSLVSDDNLKKCQSVGADRQLTKTQLPGLVDTIDELLGQAVPA